MIKSYVSLGQMVSDHYLVVTEIIALIFNIESEKQAQLPYFHSSEMCDNQFLLSEAPGVLLLYQKWVISDVIV